MSLSAVEYRVQPSDPKAHLFTVRCTVRQPEPDGQLLSYPAWTPGSYLIRDFARHVISFSASAGSRAVALEKLDKDTWRCGPCTAPLVVDYQVYAYEESVRAAHLDPSHAFFNGTSLLLRVHGQEAEPCAVELLPPPGDEYLNWRVATAMDAAGAPPHGFGCYRAKDYEELVDHPVEMGVFDLLSFEACGVPHEVAIGGRHRCDEARLRSDLGRICAHHIRFFGEPAPLQRYLFLVRAVGKGYGGLEHRSSSSLICKRSDLPQAGKAAVDEGYRDLLGLCSHEYFHVWNVKRIRPAAFQGHDLRREAYTRLLWVFEGITSYYDELALVRAGLIDAGSYLELLGRTITRVRRGSGRLRQSLSDSSFDAWTRFYKQDENAPNAIVSYYTKGALVALALDMVLRRESGDRLSLDEVMRAMWERYGVTGIGVPEDGFESTVQEVSGMDLSVFFNHALRSTKELELEEYLQWVGVELEWRPSSGQDDKGGTPGKTEARADLGIRFAADGAGARLTHVLDGGAARAAGMAPGDVIVAMDGLRVNASNLESTVANREVGEQVDVHLFRRDELLRVGVTLRSAPHDTCVPRLKDPADEVTLDRRASWLHLGGQPRP